MKHILRNARRLLPKRLRKSLGDESGTASVEFVLVVPLLMMIFMAAFESGLLMVRAILLEQSVDMTMRELRLGHYPKVTNLKLKQEICERTIVFPNCVPDMKIEMRRVSTATFEMPTTPTRCINRREEAEPVVELDAGGKNDVMLIRVCIEADAIFPTTGLGLNLPLNDGAYSIVTRTAFVVEPK